MATTTQPVTVDEFLKLPEDTGGVYHELRNGEVVELTRPLGEHIHLQRRLDRMLTAALRGYESMIEMPFESGSGQDLRCADVAVMTLERWRGLAPKGHLTGAPDLVIEVLSPSNTAREISEKERFCLANGAREFWVVDPDDKQVRVSTKDGRYAHFGSGARIPLAAFGGDFLEVDAIFVEP